MKARIFSGMLLALFVKVASFEAAELRGKVVENELGGTPMEGVKVGAFGTNLTITTSTGHFNLNFPGLQPGAKVDLAVNKEGYEVVNDIQLETTLPLNWEARPVTLILCKPSVCEEMRRRFYRLKGSQAVLEAYQKKLRELEESNQTTSEISRLKQERADALAAAERVADELARAKSEESRSRVSLQELNRKASGTAVDMARLRQERDTAQAEAKAAREELALYSKAFRLILADQVEAAQETVDKAKSRSRPAEERNIAPFALLSLGSFLAGLSILWILIAKAELLVRLGLEGKLFYLILIPLGLTVAGFLFGTLHSYALYRGEVLSGTLELGGPVVGFCLVVLGGFLLVPPPKPFAVTVFIHGEGGVQDLPLRGKGSVVLDLGPNRRHEPIRENGEAYFPGIPSSFLGQEVPVWVDADGYIVVGPPGARQRLDQASLYVVVRRLAVSLRGRTENSKSEPIAGVSLRVHGLTTESGADGSFALEVPGQMLDEAPFLDAFASGYKPWRERVTPDTNDIVVRLRRSGP